jgi:hypothetical protein
MSNTGQNYSKWTSTTNNFEPSVNLLNTITVDDFVNQRLDLTGQDIDPEVLYEQLTDSLRAQGIQHTGIRYNSILDGIRLFRSVMPAPNEVDDYHAAILIRDKHVIELALINWDEHDNINPSQLKTRHLLNRIVDSEATSVIMISSRGTWLTGFTPIDTTHINTLSESLEYFDIELIDWILLNSARNLSHLQTQGWDYSQEGISPDDVYTIGVKH